MCETHKTQLVMTTQHFFLLPLKCVQVSPVPWRRRRPSTASIRWTWSSASTFPMRLWRRGWVTAGSTLPAAEFTTWDSTPLEFRYQTCKSEPLLAKIQICSSRCCDNLLFPHTDCTGVFQSWEEFRVHSDSAKTLKKGGRWGKTQP